MGSKIPTSFTHNQRGEIMLQHRTHKYTIKEILNNKDTVYVFDVDGTLTDFNYAARSFWNPTMNPVSYNGVRPLKTTQKLISSLDKDKVFICSRAALKGEPEAKKKFLLKNFNLRPDHIYFVEDNSAKIDVLKKIQNLTKVEDELLLLIEDSTDVLYNVLVNTNYSNMHVSYFIK